MAVGQQDRVVVRCTICNTQSTISKAFNTYGYERWIELHHRSFKMHTTFQVTIFDGR
jgi:hypothetical protein